MYREIGRKRLMDRYTHIYIEREREIGAELRGDRTIGADAVYYFEPNVG